MFVLTQDQFVFLLTGAGWTLLLSAIGFIMGAILGLPLALMRVSSNRLLANSVLVFIHTVQGIPLPVVMFLAYFGLGFSGFNVPALLAAGLALSLYASAYLAEIWRGCIESVPKTQWEAAECLALTDTQRLLYVILPQSIKIAVPPTVGFLVQIVKDTSNAVVIGFFDLAYSAKVLNNATFSPFVIYSIAAVIYFLICFPLTSLAAYTERKMTRT